MTEADVRSNMIPCTWAWTELESIAQKINPGFPSGKHNKVKRGIPHIRPMNISPKGHIDLSNLKYVEESDYEKLLKGDILFNNTNSPEMLGKTTYIKQDTNWAYSNHMTRIRLFVQYLEPAWVAFYLHHLFLKGFFKMNCVHHVNQASINSGFLSQKVPIPLAPFREQQRIITKIEELFSRLDAGVKALQKAKSQLQRYRQSVLKAAVEGRLTEEWRKAHPEVEPTKGPLNTEFTDVPKEYVEDALFDLPGSWAWTTLGNLIAEGPQNGLYLPQSSYGSGFPILRIDDFQDDCSRSTNQLRLVNAGAEDIEKYCLKNGDLVINRVNSPSHLGKCLLVSARNLPAIFESNMMRMKLSQLADPQFVVIYLRSLFGKRQITKNAKWAVNQASINQKDVSNTFVPYPSLAEQQVISEKVDGCLSLSYHIGNSIANEIKRADRLLQSILMRAFEGKLVPQDPSDEPASVLLEQIKAERSIDSPRRGRRIKRNNTQQMRLPQ